MKGAKYGYDCKGYVFLIDMMIIYIRLLERKISGKAGIL
jgi:hypothetical protein